MYKEVTYRYEKYMQKNMQKVVNIYFDNVLVDPIYITDFKKSGTLFSKELELGSTPSQHIEIKIHKKANIQIPKQIKVEFGVLVNNALTLYEVNKMLLGELNVTPLRSLAKHNYDFEMVPIGIFNVDDYNDKDSNLIIIKAYDNIIKLENDSGYYDITPILKQDSNNRKYATLGEIAEDICQKKGLELGSKSFLNSTKKMYVYDNSITAREYMGYIAEAAGCFACAGRDGKIYFRSIGEDTIEIPQNLFKTYKYGEQYKISRVAYENGIESFKFGTEANNTLWISQDNIFITDEDEVNSIYNKVKDLTVYSFEGTVVIDPRVDIGDIIIVDGKKIIYQGEMTFGGRPRANIKSKISMKARSETTVRTPSQKTINRRVQSRIDEEAGKITQIIDEVYNEDGTSKISKHEQTINGITTTVSEVHTKVNNMKFGGTNLLRGTNTVDKLGNGKWSESSWRQASGGTGTRQSINVENPPNNNIKLGWHISSTNSQVTICQDDVPTTNEEEYTISCYAKGTGKIYLQYGNATLGYQNTQIDVTSEWKEYSYTFKSKGTANAYAGVNATGHDIQICGMKLEKGNINSDWSPAPEDTEEILSKMNSTIEQTASSITQKVNDIENLTNVVEGTKTLSLGNCLEGNLVELHIYGNNNVFDYLSPSSTLTPGANLSPKGDSRIVVKDSTNKSTTYELGITEVLRSNGNTTDEYILKNGKAQIIRRISKTGAILATPTTEDLGELKINLTKGTNTITIQNYSAKLKARFVIINSLTNVYATEIEMNSAIESTANSINLTVSKKVGKDDVCSTISQSAEEILLKGNRVLIQSDNFKLDKKGNMEAVNGRFTGGNIDLVQENNRENPCFTISMKNDVQQCKLFPTYFAMYDDYSKGLSGSYIEAWINEYMGQLTLFNSLSQYTTISTNQIETTGEVIATAFNNNSRVELKENIKMFNEHAINLINSTDIYNFNYKNDKYNKCVGLIIGKGYNTPNEVISNNEAVDLYSMTSISWKAIQELDQKIEKVIKILKKIPILGKIITKRWKL